MQPLYPEIKPYQRHVLPVDDLHTLYVEESGDPSGIPILFVHGGPGGGSSSNDRRFFDPEKFRIILFDQRGTGRSTPHACIERNTTKELIEDIEKIRTHLSIEQWCLFGGSWGSTLSLLYTQAYSSKVLGLILRGIFLCRSRDLDWLYKDGANRIYPDYWKDFVAPIAPHAKTTNVISAYYEKLTGDNELAKMGAAKAWALWEGRCATLKTHPEVINRFSNPHLALSIACIESHYFINNGFIRENQIIGNMSILADIPGIIVHGRYDMVCPLDNAHALHEQWPASELHIIRDAGHSSQEPGIIDGLVKATNDMALRLSGEGDSSC